MAYITGSADHDFPVTPGAYQTTDFTLCCARTFIAKLNPLAAGSSSLIYSTFLGGSTGTAAASIAVDSSGSAYVTGQTGLWFSSTAHPVPFPTTPGAFLQDPGVQTPVAFVTKLNPGGSGLVYSTLLGKVPVQNSLGTGIALDASGEAYVTGYSGANFPTTPDAFQPNYQGGGAHGYDAFVTKFNAAGTALIYSSYLGGATGDDVATGIAVDGSGDAYVAGYTGSRDFPAVVSFRPFLNGTSDAFVAKLHPSGANQLSVVALLPNHGGNGGSATITIVGGGFQPRVTVKLSCPNQSDIVATNVTMGLGGRTLSVTFNLIGATPEACSLVITDPDGSSITQSQGFNVEQGGQANVWADLVGPSVVRFGHLQTYYLLCGNSGNLDARRVSFWIAFPQFLGWSVGNGSVPVSADQLNGYTILTFQTPVLPETGTVVTPIILSPPSSRQYIDQRFEIRTWTAPQ
jgi:hypothetical protein